MSPDLIKFLLGGGLSVGLLILGLGAGSIAERRHYCSIRRRERLLRNIMIFAVRRLPPEMSRCDTILVSGSVVVGMDYFKRFAAYLRNLVGGKVGSYETLLDRARREALLRLKEQARARRAQCVFNVKFSTANIMSGDRNNHGSGCVEVIAYGTAVIPR